MKKYAIFIGLFVALSVTSVPVWAQDDDPAAACAGEHPFDQIVCYAEIAVEHADLSVCDQAEHEGVRYQCYAYYATKTRNEEICRKVPVTDEESQALVDLCFSDIAALSKDETLCAEMVTDTLRDDCYFKVAQAKEDPGICERIEAEERRNFCLGKPTYIE